mmetsp:Transcript_12235/g.28232  ORF Transcript_12235/g.28232 Transcript_12235/m.28232 type:complete len:248 (-) Transcript_12235:627-1370(-)
MDRLQLRLLVAAVVEPHHVETEVQPALHPSPVLLARELALELVLHILKSFPAPRALAHDVHVYLQDRLPLPRGVTSRRRRVFQRLVDASFDLPSRLDVCDQRAAHRTRHAVRPHRFADSVESDLRGGGAGGWEEEKRSVEAELSREDAAVPTVSSDAPRGHDVVKLPGEEDGVVLGAEGGEFSLQLLVEVEGAEVAPADRAREDLVDRLEDRAEGREGLGVRLLLHVDAAGVHVSPEGSAEHRAVWR